MNISWRQQNRNKNGSHSEAGNNEEDGKDDQPKGEEHFQDKQVVVLPSGIEREAPFWQKVFCKPMRNKRIPANYRNKKMELLSISVWA